MLTLLSPHRKTFITITEYRDEKNQRKSPRIRSLFDKDNMMETFAVPAIKRAYPYTTKTLSRAGVSTVYEAQGRMGLMKP